MNLRERLRRLGDDAERFTALDNVGSRIHTQAQRALRAGPVKDLLTGSWLGHPVHPAVVGLPIGALAGASVLDALSGATDRSADRMLAFGLASAVPAAASGMADWTDTEGAEQRVGVLHAAANTGALVLYGASLVARAQGHRRLGAVLALGGAGALAVGGDLGGHLAYALGVGVDTTAFQAGDLDWTAVTDGDLSEGEQRVVEVAGTKVLLTRRQGGLVALANRCTHRGGPLGDGTFDDSCVTCPWHGSRFRLATGEVEGGPATRPQPRYRTRRLGGRLQVARREERTLRTNPV